MPTPVTNRVRVSSDGPEAGMVLSKPGDRRRSRGLRVSACGLELAASGATCAFPSNRIAIKLVVFSGRAVGRCPLIDGGHGAAAAAYLVGPHPPRHGTLNSLTASPGVDAAEALAWTGQIASLPKGQAPPTRAFRNCRQELAEPPAQKCMRRNRLSMPAPRGVASEAEADWNFRVRPIILARRRRITGRRRPIASRRRRHGAKVALGSAPFGACCPSEGSSTCGLPFLVGTVWLFRPTDGIATFVDRSNLIRCYRTADVHAATSLPLNGPCFLVGYSRR